MRRQIMKQPYLVAHIQVFDCFADFLNRAHRRNLIEAISDGKPLLEWSGVSCQISDLRIPLTFKGEAMIRTLRMFDGRCLRLHGRKGFP
jgi:hypothetical protein